MKLLPALFLAAVYFTSARAADTFLEKNGLISMQIESAPLAGSWVKETAEEGFTGTCYYTWNKGTPTTITPAGEGVLSYRIKVSTSGTYNMRWYNYHNYPDDQTLCNDSWIRLDSGSWIKVHQGAGGAWSWVCKYDVVPHEVFDYLSFNISAGYHTIQVSGRSYRHSIDRIHLYRDNVYKPMSLNHPESPREGQTMDPDHVVKILEPAAGTALAPGQVCTLTASGTVLFWKYDLDNDGTDIKSAGSRNERVFTVPAAAGTSESIAVLLTGSFGTDKQVYPILKSGITPLFSARLLPGSAPGLQLRLDRADRVKTVLYKVNGQPVSTEDQGLLAAGTHQLPITGAGLAPGMFLLKIDTQNSGCILRQCVITY